MKYFLILLLLFPVAHKGADIQAQMFLIEKEEKQFLTILQTEYIKILEREEKQRLEKVRKEKIEYALKHETSLLALRLKSLVKSHLGYLSVLIQKERDYQEKQRRITELKQRQIFANIDISKQRMLVYKGDKLLYKWKVSSGKRGHATPRGKYSALATVKNYVSRKYNAPMPYSVFFKSGYAIHATNSVKRLGSPASHGCIRLAKSNAKKFYSLVRKMGKKNTTIRIAN